MVARTHLGITCYLHCLSCWSSLSHWYSSRLCIYNEGGLGLVQINIVACLFSLSLSLCSLNICFQDIGDRVCSSYVLKINWRFTMATCVKVLRFSVAMENLGLVHIVLARRIDIGRIIIWRKFSFPKPDWFRRDHKIAKSVRMEQLSSHWTDFHEIGYLSIFRKKLSRKFKFN